MHKVQVAARIAGYMERELLMECGDVVYAVYQQSCMCDVHVSPTVLLDHCYYVLLIDVYTTLASTRATRVARRNSLVHDW